jgi:hypothetical protein
MSPIAAWPKEGALTSKVQRIEGAWAEDPVKSRIRIPEKKAFFITGIN